jgi:tetratricopeptide (TPR) repeat protein
MRLLLFVILAGSAPAFSQERPVVAPQGSVAYVSVTVACGELNETAMAQARAGHSREAEATLSSAVARGIDPGCAGLVLTNIAANLAVSGQVREAETVAGRAVASLDKSETRQDRVLLRALQILASTRIEQGKVGRARAAYQRMRELRIEEPNDAALAHEIGGSLLQIAGNWREAEAEYLAAIRSWDAAGRGEMADVAPALGCLASLYVQERRLGDARRTLDRALEMTQRSGNIAPADRLKLLGERATVRFLDHDFQEAEQDAREAIALADRTPELSEAYRAILLADYARILRKNRHNQEARSIETRAAALRRNTPALSIVDVTELANSGK